MDESNVTPWFETFITWISGSTGAGVSFALNIVMLILTIAGFLMYFQQKREYRLLSGILTEYGLKEKIETDASAVKKKKDELDSKVKSVKDQLEAAEKDLKERLPLEARKAYFENTIPVVQQQVFELSKQLENMESELSNLGGSLKNASPEIDDILSEEVKNNVSIKRDMEKARTTLAVLTGAAAAIGAIMPYPLSVLAGILAPFIIKECWSIYKLSKTYYADKNA
ncbi:MAG: hypothetical protein ABJK37_05595 [Paraglaciecola sp.]|uniref:hypothetical protein n=1 Tax=Paraglaciecola sp. TaxID=1920173 RepID=UPI003296F5D3